MTVYLQIHTVLLDHSDWYNLDGSNNSNNNSCYQEKIQIAKLQMKINTLWMRSKHTFKIIKLEKFALVQDTQKLELNSYIVRSNTTGL